MKPAQDTPLEDRLAAACRRRFGPQLRVDDVTRLSAGASSQTWRFAIASGAGEPRDEAGAAGSRPSPASPRRAVLQLFGGGEQYPLALDKRTQALVQAAAFGAGVPTPEVLFVLEPADALGEGFVTRWCEGETLGQRIVQDAAYAQARERLAQDCGRALAAIHRLDASALPALPARPADVGLRLLRDTHRSYGKDVPVFELAMQWLEDHLPPPCQPCLVHGDFRTGNLMVGPDGLRAVLDWEMAHLGDPLEDLGWLSVNAWRFGRIDRPIGGFALREDLYRAYEQAGGSAPVDRDAIRFWQTFGTLQWGVMCQWFAAQFVDGSVRDIERLAIGRRISEVQLDLMDLLRGRD